MPEPARPRPASIAPYVIATALGSTAYISVVTAAPLAAREITGSTALSGVPTALGTIATAAAIGLLTAIMSRSGRRAGIVTGLAVAIAGAAALMLAISTRSFPLLIAGTMAIGFGNAALQVARYAASDLVAPHRRAAAVGTVVWGSTAGAVLGPSLLQPSASVAEAVGLQPLEGAMAVTLVGFGLALLVAVAWVRGGRPAAHEAGAHPDPTSIEAGVGGEDAAAEVAAVFAPGPGIRGLLAPRHVRVALIALITAQFVMTLLMAMTPVHIHDMGEPLVMVGVVISAHTLGMFALSPISGRLVVRFGAIRLLYAGFATLVVSAWIAAIADRLGIPVLALAMFLLGYGWNLCFVAGSGLLTRGASLAQRIRLQGSTDVLVWTFGALASVSSGLLLGWTSFPFLSVVGAVVVAIPAVSIVLARRRPHWAAVA